MNLSESFNRWKKILFSLKKLERRFDLIESNIQNLVNASYSDQIKDLTYKAFLKSKEYQVYSQNGEDGLLLYIFSEIGTTNRKAIEFGIGNGKQCNTANLILNFGWQVLMIDGNNNGIKEAKDYYANHPNSISTNVTLVNEFITSKNINQLFKHHGVTGQVDLLSIDIDGNDYWIWETIDSVNPRVVVIEYNASFNSNESISVVYEETFYRYDKHKSGWYHGASLKALEKLGLKKGYSLIGCDSNGVNAFFIRNDIKLKTLQTVSAKDAFYPEKKRSKSHNQEQQFELIKHLSTINI